jgi:hypothetical protein
MAYLSSAAFVVRCRSRFDRRMPRPALSTWRSTFWHLLEGELAAAPPRRLLLLRCPTCISGLALEAGGDGWRLWDGLGEAAGGREPSSTVLRRPGGSRWSSSAALCEPGGGCWSPPAALTPLTSSLGGGSGTAELDLPSRSSVDALSV